MTLLFNKGLVHYLNKEYKEAMEVYSYLKEQLMYKNAVLINMFLIYLRLEDYESIIGMVRDIQESETFLDYDEKNLKKLYLYAREKLKIVN